MWTVKILDTAKSTQDEALVYAKNSDEYKKMVFYSKNQTHGYGTNGRSWISADLSFAASFLFPLKTNTANISSRLLPIIFALLIASKLEASIYSNNVAIGIKWPNDLFKNKKKIGGVLVHLIQKKETNMSSKLAILGIGINIAWHPKNAPPYVSSLFDDFESGKSFNSEKFITELTRSIDDFDSDPISINPDKEFKKRDILKNKNLIILVPGDKIIFGKNIVLCVHGRRSLFS